MRIATLAIAASAALVVMTSGALAQPAGLDGSYDPAEMSDEVKARPQTQGATGDQQRHYWFEEAGVEMPYRIYVPASYDPGTPTPLVVALHGYAGDQDYFFRFARDVPSKSEEHGFIFVAPMGYNYGGWYGVGGPATRGEDATTADIMRNGHSVTDLSEMDVMNVLQIVRNEYNIDSGNIFLMGHSMGGAGTWYVGQKYADIWAGLAALSGSGNRFFTPDYEKLAAIPMHISVGSEETGSLAGHGEAVAGIRDAGGRAEFMVVEHGTHGGMIVPTMPVVLDFFAEIAAGE
jgi:predicted peptidase